MTAVSASPFVTIDEDSEDPPPIAVLANDSDADSRSAVRDTREFARRFGGHQSRRNPGIHADSRISTEPPPSPTRSPTARVESPRPRHSYAVTPVNDAPVAIAQALSMNEDGSLNITLSGSDLDEDITVEDLIYTVTVDPFTAHWKVSVESGFTRRIPISTARTASPSR